MDDSEAKYLIDQFNKYASWTTMESGPMFSMSALVVSFSALFIVVGNVLGLLSDIAASLRLALVIILVVLPLVLLGVLLIRTWQIIREHERNMEKLKTLENHRFKYRSLPEGLTFENIADCDPEELKKFLAANQPKESP